VITTTAGAPPDFKKLGDEGDLFFIEQFPKLRGDIFGGMEAMATKSSGFSG